jgi:glycosyltransferase involved in cell wall biosynthesis
LTPPPRIYGEKRKLLFVANDFTRKGGDFLLRLYREHLAGAYTLTIASNDPTISTRRLPPGVEWLRGRNREQLIDVYRAHDVFLFPTRQDYMPQVIAEALATGLPCIATDVGGIRDLVHNGETGVLMPFGASTSDWAEHLAKLAEPMVLRQLSAGARRFAEERLRDERFASLMKDILNRLQRKAPKSQDG